MKQFDMKLTEVLQYKQETFAVGSQFPFGDLKIMSYRCHDQSLVEWDVQKL